MCHWLPGRWLDAMRPEGCAIQYAAGGLDALLDRRRPVVARATAVWAACSSKPGGTAGLFFFFFFFLWKKAYMPIDANHTSNPKDR